MGYRVAFRQLLPVALALGLGLAGIMTSSQSSPSHASGNHGVVSIRAGQAEAYEGGLAVFHLRRIGGWREGVTVQVRTWEPDHEDALGQNATEQTHDVIFENFAREATLEVGVWVDQWQDVGDLELKAQVQPAGDGRYLVDEIDTATIGHCRRPECHAQPPHNHHECRPDIGRRGRHSEFHAFP